MTDDELMRRLDASFSHVWMVRAFLKHSDEAEDDEELCEVHRTLYDVMHALGPSLEEGNAASYLKQARKKLSKLLWAAQFFREIQPEVSQHMNFRMAAQSLTVAAAEIQRLLQPESASPTE